MSNRSSVEILMKQIKDDIDQDGDEDIKFINPQINSSVSNRDALLAQINASWEIPFDVPIIQPPTIKGKITSYIKKVISKLINWRIHDLNIRQNNFNADTVRSINYLDKQLEESKLIINKLEQEVDKLISIVNIMKNNTEQNSKPINYFRFENKFRGSRELIKEYQSVYLKFIDTNMKVLDLGCGRGEFVELLTTNGIEVVGVDSNDEMINECIRLELPVVKDNLFNYLEKTSEKFDCIF